jgi:Uma2 family endonuclease
LFSAEEYARTVDPRGTKTELVRGRIVSMPPAHTKHGWRADLISKRLGAFADQNELGITTGEGGYLLSRDPDTVRGPDAAFIARERIPPGGLPDEAYFEGAPTLAVEVVSPDDRDRDVAEKIRDYMQAGADRVWEVRPRLKTVTVHRTSGETTTYRLGDVLTSEDAGFAVDGFVLPLSDIFS